MDAESLYANGKEAADRGNYDYAIAMLLDVVTNYPDHLNSRLALRACEEQLFQSRGRGFLAKLSAVIKGFPQWLKMNLMVGSPQRTMVACEKFLVNWPSCTPVLIKLADALRKLEHPGAAISTLEYAAHRQPQNTRVLWSLAGLYEEQDEYTKASRCLDTILRFTPNDDQAKQKLKNLQSVGHMYKTKIEEGASSYDTVRDKEKAKEYAMSERIVQTVDQFDQELASLQERLRESPTDVKLLTRIGDLYARQDKLRLALQAYEKAQEVETRYQTREKIGDLKLRIFAEEEKEAALAAQSRPNDPQARAKLQEVRKRRAEHAVEEYEYRVKEHPTEVRIAERLGDAYMMRRADGDLRRAITQYQRAVNDARIKARAHRKLGRCFAQSEKTADMALAQFDRARNSTFAQQEQKEIDYEIGQLNEKLGRNEKALEAYKRIFEVDADFRDVADKVMDLGKV